MANNGVRCRNQALPGKKYCRLSSHGPKRLTRGQRITIVVGAVGFIASIVGIYGCFSQRRAERQNATSVSIFPSSLRTPQYLSFGTVKFLQLYADGIVIRDADDPILTVHIRSTRSVACLWLWNCRRQMVVSAKVRNLKGEPVVEVTNKRVVSPASASDF